MTASSAIIVPVSTYDEFICSASIYLSNAWYLPLSRNANCFDSKHFAGPHTKWRSVNTTSPHSQSHRWRLSGVARLVSQRPAYCLGSHVHRHQPPARQADFLRRRYTGFHRGIERTHGHPPGECRFLFGMCELAHTSRGNLLAKNVAELEPLARTR